MAQQTALVQNQFTNTNQMRARFTVNNANETGAQIANVYLIPGVGNAAARSLNAAVTYSGDFGTFAEFLAYMDANKLMITEIRFQTDNTANFSETLILGTRRPNNQNPSERQINLVDFRKSTGNGYADDLTIPSTALNDGVLIDARTYFRFSNIVKNSTLTMYLTVAMWDAAPQLITIN